MRKWLRFFLKRTESTVPGDGDEYPFPDIGKKQVSQVSQVPKFPGKQEKKFL